ncbi:hypothetical protein LOK49_LG11G01644 [Camellia lanceoleosa]|uniref:Uncharacterized protein n=1 Tax=Camellia lanceoleosa TaxID=1840588 RepID=A0ACC0G4D7_9ERIC|nr:hypothetical protein LOK49_LG11G01644 [Camellia lanceoleosa]
MCHFEVGAFIRLSERDGNKASRWLQSEGCACKVENLVLKRVSSQSEECSCKASDAGRVEYLFAWWCEGCPFLCRCCYSCTFPLCSILTSLFFADSRFLCFSSTSSLSLLISTLPLLSSSTAGALFSCYCCGCFLSFQITYSLFAWCQIGSDLLYSRSLQIPTTKCNGDYGGGDGGGGGEDSGGGRGG